MCLTPSWESAVGWGESWGETQLRYWDLKKNYICARTCWVTWLFGYFVPAWLTPHWTEMEKSKTPTRCGEGCLPLAIHRFNVSVMCQVVPNTFKTIQTIRSLKMYVAIFLAAVSHSHSRKRQSAPFHTWGSSVVSKQITRRRLQTFVG